jgi:uncharacterized protein
MVTLKDRIFEDMKEAMRSKASIRLLTIRGILAALKQREVDERITLEDADTVVIIDKLVKQRKDSIAQFIAGQRMDLAQKEADELVILESYLPVRLSFEAIQIEVRQIVMEMGATNLTDMGRVMAAAKKQLAGRAGMDVVSVAVKQSLLVTINKP